MDVEVRKALRTIAQSGEVGLSQLLEMFPVLRHDTHVVGRFDDMFERHRIEQEEEWEKWFREIPALHFPYEWEIRILPPIARAIVRFRANHVSVYLDCYSKLGHMQERDGTPIPYWEIYPAEDGDTERFLMNDVDGLLDGLKRAVDASN